MLGLARKAKHCTRYLAQGGAFGDVAKQNAYKVIFGRETFHVMIGLVSFTVSSDDTCFYHKY